MPVKRRVTLPQTFDAPTISKSKVVAPIYAGPAPIRFTTQLQEIVAGLPSIGLTEDRHSMILKHIIPNSHRFGMFRGFYLSFRPAIRPARHAPAGHYSVAAMLVLTPTEARHNLENLDMPCLRLADPDTSTWPVAVAAWVDKIAQTYEPSHPSIIDPDYEL